MLERECMASSLGARLACVWINVALGGPVVSPRSVRIGLTMRSDIRAVFGRVAPHRMGTARSAPSGKCMGCTRDGDQQNKRECGTDHWAAPPITERTSSLPVRRGPAVLRY